MRLFIHALGASAGGGLTYLCNVLPHLAQTDGVETALLVGASAAKQVSATGNVRIAVGEERAGFSRFRWEQRKIPGFVRESGANVLLCLGNFAVWNSPVPQILLSRNSLYISTDFMHDLRCRRAYGLWLDSHVKALLARKSIERAEITIAPSQAFARELTCWTKRPVMTLHHGFDTELFFKSDDPLPRYAQARLDESEGAVRLLFVSHYNYYRNFETLFRALALLKERLPNRKIRLLLTCELEPGKNPGAYRVDNAVALIRNLHIENDVVQLGTVPYHVLHKLYRSCAIYVTAAYTETFAHPLVEAMACGLPIVASDIPVHREIAQEAATFFDKFSPGELADRVAQVLESAKMAETLSEKGRQRVNDFSWKKHVEELLSLAASIARGSV